MFFLFLFLFLYIKSRHVQKWREQRIIITANQKSRQTETYNKGICSCSCFACSLVAGKTEIWWGPPRLLPVSPLCSCHNASSLSHSALSSSRACRGILISLLRCFRSFVLSFSKTYTCTRGARILGVNSSRCRLFFFVQHAFACSRLESPSTSKTSPWLSVTAPPQNRHRELVPLGQSSSPASIKTIVVSDGVLVRPSSGLQHFFRHFFLLSPLAEGCTTLAAAAAAAASVPVAAPPESACSHQSRA